MRAHNGPCVAAPTALESREAGLIAILCAFPRVSFTINARERISAILMIIRERRVKRLSLRYETGSAQRIIVSVF